MPIVAIFFPYASKFTMHIAALGGQTTTLYDAYRSPMLPAAAAKPTARWPRFTLAYGRTILGQELYR
jgi:hypothetical protein